MCSRKWLFTAFFVRFGQCRLRLRRRCSSLLLLSSSIHLDRRLESLIPSRRQIFSIFKLLFAIFGVNSALPSACARTPLSRHFCTLHLPLLPTTAPALTYVFFLCLLDDCPDVAATFPHLPFSAHQWSCSGEEERNLKLGVHSLSSSYSPAHLPSHRTRRYEQTKATKAAM